MNSHYKHWENLSIECLYATLQKHYSEHLRNGFIESEYTDLF